MEAGGAGGWCSGGGGEAEEVEHQSWKGEGRVVGLLPWVKEHCRARAGGGRELCLAGNGTRHGSRAEEGEGMREGGGVGVISSFSKT